jgi:hypothetical protein
MSIEKKGQTKQSAASLVFSASVWRDCISCVVGYLLWTTVSWLVNIFYARWNHASLVHCYGCIQINVNRKQLMQLLLFWLHCLTWLS